MNEVFEVLKFEAAMIVISGCKGFIIGSVMGVTGAFIWHNIKKMF